MTNQIILLIFTVPACFVVFIRWRVSTHDGLYKIAYSFELFVWVTSVLAILGLNAGADDLNAHELFFVCAMALARFVAGAATVLGNPTRKY